MNAMKRGIVLGANGYLGRNLVHFLRDQGWQVLASDLQAQSSYADPSYVSVDVTDASQLGELDWDVDAVFVFAGLTGTRNGFDRFREFVAVNEVGLLCVLNAVKESGYRPRVVFPSTRLVYEGSEQPLREDAPKVPKTVYAVNKLAGEGLLQVYANAFSIPFCVYRICVPYGNSAGTSYSYGTIGALLKQARETSVIRLYGDGELRRTFTHVEDICAQIIATTTDIRSCNSVLNVGGQDLSLRRVATLIAETHGAKVVCTDWPVDDWRIESGHTVFDAAKLTSIYEGKSKHRFEDWVRTTA